MKNLSLWGAIAASIFAAFTCSAKSQTHSSEHFTPQWKTAYYKRGFAGNYQAAWAGGTNATMRVRIPVTLSGSKVRITLAPMRGEETVVSKITLARGVDSSGKTEGTPVTVTFGGKANVMIPAGGGDVVSDEIEIPITRGDWYLQQSYSSEKFLYANSIDSYWNEAGDRHEASTLKEHKKGTWPGNVYRIEVLTSDARPMILCYGDSITHGFNATPNAGKSYPEVLSALTSLPTLNMGVNGDLVSYVGGVPLIVKTCNGVQSVVVVMGINDIISGKITKVEEYSKVAANLIASLKQSGKKIYWGTITPAGGYAKFDADPQKEVLRQEINAWIRKESGADGVMDFDKALAEPQNPSRMRAEYQSDWLHPSDAGYQKMAEAAAPFFKTTG